MEATKEPKAVFDIMTRLERQVSEHTESQSVLKRYLTLFYGFALGLGLILAIIAIIVRPQVVPRVGNSSQPTPSYPAAPGVSSNQAHSDDTPIPPATSAPTPDQNQPSPLGVTAGELNGLQISLWHPWTGKIGAAFQALLDEFNRTNRWGITVSGNGFGGFGRLDEAIEAAFQANALEGAGGQLPDVFVDYGYAARHWDRSRPLVDLAPYVDDPAWGLTSEEQADFFQRFWDEEAVAVGESATARRLGIPLYRSAYVIFYNQSWGAELGFSEPPTTPEGFRQQACAAAEDVAKREGKSEPRRGGYLVESQGGAMAGWIYAFGGEISDSGGQTYLFNTSETTAALQFLKSLQESGCAWYGKEISLRDEFARRQALFAVGSLFDIAAQGQAFTQAGNSDRWEVIPFPSDGQPVIDTYGPSLFMNPSDPARQLAGWLLIKWLSEPQNQARWSKELQVYPARLSALNELRQLSNARTQWIQAMELLPEARGEPTLISWSMVRWVLADAMTELFNPQFEAEQIPAMLLNLDSVAAEVLTQVR